MISKALYSFRETLWNIPLKLGELYSNTKPLSSIIIFSLIAVYIFSLFSSPMLYGMRNKSSSDQKYTEGIIGEFGSLNPMFITGSDIDRGIHSLLYTKLINFRDGNPEEGLAEKWEVLPSGKSMKFILRDDLYWHDGEKVDADDVVYTVIRSQEMSESGYDTYGGSLAGIEVSADSDNSVVFKFDEIIGGVYETLAIYIMPEHILKDIDNLGLYDYGLTVLPIGSGPYRAVRIEQGDVLLSSFEEYPEESVIKEIEFLFFDDLTSLKIAFQNNLLDGLGNVDPYRLEFLNQYSLYKVYTLNIPQRKKVLFQNMRNEKMKNDELRYAISQAIDKNSLTEEFASAFRSTNSPVPSTSWVYENELIYYGYDLENAMDSVKNAGYTIDEATGEALDANGARLTLDFVYLDAANNDQIVTSIESMLEKIGIKLIRRSVTYESMINEIFATRNFDIVMTELEVTNDPDQYDLWHSSKVNFPDLNIAGYEYDRMDLLLEDARIESNKKLREEDYYQMQRYLALDLPVITLYEPSYSLVIKENYKNIQLDKISLPFERFWNITEWELE